MLEDLEAQLKAIRNIPRPPQEGLDTSLVLAHAFLTDILPHLPSSILRNVSIMADLRIYGRGMDTLSR